MIQGGCPLRTVPGAPATASPTSSTPEVAVRLPLLAMANAGPNTNGSQFFITVGKTPHLNFGTIFGEVADQARSGRGRRHRHHTGRMDKPIDDVVIESVDIIT